jgi:hypothetical protein
MSKLLGKKRPTKDTCDDDEVVTSKLRREEDHENGNSENGEAKKDKKLFGDTKTGGLFGNLEEKKDSEADNKNKLFQDKGNANTFSNSTLFSGDNKGSSLFNFSTTASSGSSLFGGQKLFDFGSIKKDEGSFFKPQEAKTKSDEEDNGEEGEDDVLQGSESPSYNPTTRVAKDEKSDYVKKFVRQIDNILVYNKEENKFVSKGSGFISVEYTDKDDKKAAFVVFRYILLL